MVVEGCMLNFFTDFSIDNLQKCFHTTAIVMFV